MARSDNSMIGAAKYERVENDFYPTPPDCTIPFYEFLIKEFIISPDSVVYEPACGDGAISKVFEAYGHKVHSSDLYPQYDGADVKDFLTGDFMIEHDGARPLFITNPPYGKWADKFMDRMLDLVHNDGVVAAMLMRNEVDSASTRMKFFENCPYYQGKIALTWRPRWIADSTGSPRHNYAWFLWTPGINRNSPPFIRYLKKAKIPKG